MRRSILRMCWLRLVDVAILDGHGRMGLEAVTVYPLALGVVARVPEHLENGPTADARVAVLRQGPENQRTRAVPVMGFRRRVQMERLSLQLMGKRIAFLLMLSLIHISEPTRPY